MVQERVSSPLLHISPEKDITVLGQPENTPIIYLSISIIQADIAASYSDMRVYRNFALEVFFFSVSYQLCDDLILVYCSVLRQKVFLQISTYAVCQEPAL